MPSKSKSQSKFMFEVLGIKEGKIKGKGNTGAGKAAKGMSEGQVKEFTKTKSKNLPTRKGKK